VEENGKWFVTISRWSLKTDFRRTDLEAERSVSDPCLFIPSFVLFLVTFLRDLLFFFKCSYCSICGGLQGPEAAGRIQSKGMKEIRTEQREEPKYLPLHFWHFLVILMLVGLVICVHKKDCIAPWKPMRF